MFIVAIFLAIHNSQEKQNLDKYPPKDKWLMKIWLLYTMKEYPAVRKNKIAREICEARNNHSE